MVTRRLEQAYVRWTEWGILKQENLFTEIKIKRIQILVSCDLEAQVVCKN
jgi:hypothetical protein